MTSQLGAAQLGELQLGEAVTAPPLPAEDFRPWAQQDIQPTLPKFEVIGY